MLRIYPAQQAVIPPVRGPLDANTSLSRRLAGKQGMMPHAMGNGAGASTVEDVFIELANRLADAAAEITTKFFRCAAAVRNHECGKNLRVCSVKKTVNWMGNNT